MKVLVTGSTGLLGNNVVRQLVDRGDQVRVLVRDPGAAAIEGLPVEVVAGRVEDAEAVDRAAEGVDVIVHSAGMVQIGWSQLPRFETVNVEGTQRIVDAALRVRARLVHVSTVNTLGTAGEAAEADEEQADSRVVPCPYVVTKRAAEEVVRRGVEGGLVATIVHPGFMLGPWDWKPSSGKMLIAVATRFTPLAPVGGCSVCDVRDVAAAILAAAEAPMSGRGYILAGHNLSYFELWRAMSDVADARGPIGRLGPLLRWAAGGWGDLGCRLTGRESDVNSAAIRMSGQRHYFSSRRAQSELQYRVRPLEETLADAWQWFTSHGYVS